MLGYLSELDVFIWEKKEGGEKLLEICIRRRHDPSRAFNVEIKN